ncbi:Spy/CpxP family protein refolding chaperone [Azospirillum sp. sgz301742]
MLARGLVALILLVPAVAPAQTPSPYAGQQTREIKALSPEDMESLLKAKGMGLAKAAELNGYPGPPHVLDLAADLGLSAEQVTAMKDILARMTAAAKPLGTTIVERERDLDRQFAERRIDQASLAAATAGIAQIQGELRAVHLAAHLETRAALSDEQASRYNTLRGYGGPGNEMGHGHHGQGKPHGG